MKDNSDIILEMKYFGPIINANINIKPLTVFIGKNKVGKSYVAKLFYALCKANSRDKVRTEIERVFAINANSLINKGSESTSFNIKKGNKECKFELNKFELNIKYIDDQSNVELKELIPFNDMFFLPASRSGIIQSLYLLISSILRISPLEVFQLLNTIKTNEDVKRLIIERILLPGEINDFLLLLIQLHGYKNINIKYKYITEKFEYIMKGNIFLKDYTLYYHDYINNIDVELNRSSSGIQELAPLYLITKYLITEGSLLIIEEPEAHLHPELIRSMARILAFLVRRGVYVIITTHSDYLIEQLSLLIKLSNLDSSKREKLGYEREEYLKSDEVSAYLFKYSEDLKGSVAEELRIDKEEGIPSDEFAKVVNELRNEYIRIEINEGQ